MGLRNRRPRIKDVVQEAYLRAKQAGGTISRADAVLITAEAVLDRLMEMLDDIDEHGIEGKVRFGDRELPISFVAGVFDDDK